MTAPTIGVPTIPAPLLLDRMAANRYYRAAVETPDLNEAIELRTRALRMRAELPPVSAVPLPTAADADLDAWLDDAADTVQLEQSRAARDTALTHLIDQQDRRISAVANNSEEALTRLNDIMATIMGIARRLVDRLDGCRNAAQIVANGDPEPPAAFQELRALRLEEYDTVRGAQDWIISVDHRVPAYRSKYLYDDDLASDFAIANLDEIFPAWKEPKHEFSITATSDLPEADPRPWPKDPTEQFIWLVVSGAKVWVPTWSQLAELGRQRIEERRHATGVTRPFNRKQQRHNKPRQIAVSELLNKDMRESETA